MIHRRELSREQRRWAERAGPHPAESVVIARIGDDVWLDVASQAGVRFTPAEWQQFINEAAVLLLEIVGPGGIVFR